MRSLSTSQWSDSMTDNCGMHPGLSSPYSTSPPQPKQISWDRTPAEPAQGPMPLHTARHSQKALWQESCGSRHPVSGCCAFSLILSAHADLRLYSSHLWGPCRARLPPSTFSASSGLGHPGWNSGSTILWLWTSFLNSLRNLHLQNGTTNKSSTHL